MTERGIDSGQAWASKLTLGCSVAQPSEYDPMTIT